MDITNEDLQQIALRLGILEMEKAVLEREKRDLITELEITQARLEEVGNPKGLVAVMAPQDVS